MNHIELLTTGGTIEKTYDETTGVLNNTGSIVHQMLRRLQLPETQVHVRELMHKDSLEFTDDDRLLILRTVQAAAHLGSSVVILHGTDTLSLTGELLRREIPELNAAVVLTGAMRPYEMKRSDALQNLTEALLASTILVPDVYCVIHGQALRFPGVFKDRERMTFIRAETTSS